MRSYWLGSDAARSPESVRYGPNRILHDSLVDANDGSTPLQ